MRLNQHAAEMAAYWGDEAQAVVSEYVAAMAERPRLLKDLARFCYAAESVPTENVERTEGRREVFFHIARMLELSPADFVKLIEGKPIS